VQRSAPSCQLRGNFSSERNGHSARYDKAQRGWLGPLVLRLTLLNLTSEISTNCWFDIVIPNIHKYRCGVFLLAYPICSECHRQFRHENKGYRSVPLSPWIRKQAQSSAQICYRTATLKSSGSNYRLVSLAAPTQSNFRHKVSSSELDIRLPPMQHQ
jgi:hypothetical protein